LIGPVGDESPFGGPLTAWLEEVAEPPELYPDETEIFLTARCH
jgi:hypothetical protein